MEAIEARWGTHSCAACGATIVLGERTGRIRYGGRSDVLCSACAAQPETVLRVRMSQVASSEAA
jgi:hypothetical protein